MFLANEENFVNGIFAFSNTLVNQRLTIFFIAPHCVDTSSKISDFV